MNDPAVGQYGTWSTRCEQLDKLVARICAASGITCRARTNAAGRLSVTFAEPVDRSNQIVLSDQNDLSTSRIQVRPPSADTLIGAGAGEGVARDFVERSVPSLRPRPREQVVDLSSVESVGELSDATDLELAARTGGLAVSGDVASSLVWLDDYDVGDLVAIELDEIRYTLPIVAARFELSPTVQRVTPVLGSLITDRFRGLLADVDELQSRTVTEIR